jgi:hypothetical protein
VGHNIEEVDYSEQGHITLPDDPKVGTLYKVTNPAFEDGEYSVNEIGVNARAKSVAICDASNKADKEQNPNALSMSEVTMNVWTEKSGGQWCREQDGPQLDRQTTHELGCAGCIYYLSPGLNTWMANK